MKEKNTFTTLKNFLIDGFSQSGDVETREMKSNKKQADLLYIKTVCDSKTINRYLVTPFWETESMEEYENFLMSFPSCMKQTDLPTAVEKILSGSVAVFVSENLYLFEAKNVQSSPVSEPTVEADIQGPQDAFNEDIMTSINLVRYRYQTSSFRVDLHTVGKKSKTNIAVVYDREIVNQEALDEFLKELPNLDIQVLQSAGQLQRNMVRNKWNIFPIVLLTERPDRVVNQLSKGKVIVLIDKTPFAMILPCTFNDFFTAMDEFAQLPIIGWTLRGLRYVGLFATIILPGLYIGTISYNPEFFKVQLAFSIVASRAAVPYASYLEVIFMLFMMEFITEASIRLPKAIGPTATTVGGLILGQAATQAGLISNIMIIIVSVVGISNYVIPIIEMSLAIRVLKYIFIIFATIAGLTGIVVGIVLLVFYLASLTSFGTPYLRMIRKGGKM